MRTSHPMRAALGVELLEIGQGHQSNQSSRLQERWPFCVLAKRTRNGLSKADDLGSLTTWTCRRQRSALGRAVDRPGELVDAIVPATTALPC